MATIPAARRFDLTDWQWAVLEPLLPPGRGRSRPLKWSTRQLIDHALGRSRGGLSTKLHLACEQGRKPLVMRLTARQCGDSPQFIAVLDELRVPASVPVGHGRVRTGSNATGQ